MFGILIGYGLIFFTLNVGRVDVLPDFIGYYLLFRGLDRLCYKSDSFKKARSLSLIMIIVSLFAAVAAFFAVFAKPAALLSVLMGLVTLYYVVKGIGEIEISDSMDLSYKKYGKFYYLFAVSQLAASLIPVGEGAMVKLLLTMAAIGAIVSSIILLIFFYHAKVVYDYVEEPETDVSEAPKRKKKKRKKIVKGRR